MVLVDLNVVKIGFLKQGLQFTRVSQILQNWHFRKEMRPSEVNLRGDEGFWSLSLLPYRSKRSWPKVGALRKEEKKIVIFGFAHLDFLIKLQNF